MNKEIIDLAKEFIDAVGSDVIELRHQKDISTLYSSTVKKFENEIRPISKANKELAFELKQIFKEGIKKGETDLGKILFYRKQFKKIIETLKKLKLNPELYRSVETALATDIDSFGRNHYEKWFDWCVRHGEGCYLSSHNARLTHSSSRGSSIDIRFYCYNEMSKQGYLFTESKMLSLDKIDWSYYDNKYSSISGFYYIQYGGVFLGDLIKNGKDIFSYFTQDKNLSRFWQKKLRGFILEESKNSYFLNKQVYYPVCSNKYHLLLPLASSSLAQHLYYQFQDYFTDSQKEARTKRKEGRFSELAAISYPNKAMLKVTQSNHSNASKLNGLRGGRLALLSCEPPQWASNKFILENKQTIFDRQLQHVLKEEVYDLKVYLSLLRNKHLSSSHPQRNASIKKKALTIIAAFFDYIESISMTVNQPIGATEFILPTEQKMLFFTLFEKESNSKPEMIEDWQIKLSKTFAHWLNQQLNKGKRSLGLTPIHEAIWTDWFSVNLREYSITKEATL